jgi:hypothetical protein
MDVALLAIAALIFGGAAAQGAGDQLNQLETARLPQQAQRGEFGVAGDNSAFKFRFSNPVCPHGIL